MTFGAVGVLVFPSNELGIGFPVSRGAITADQEKFSKETPGWQWGLSEDVRDGLGDGLSVALRFSPWILL